MSIAELQQIEEELHLARMDVQEYKHAADVMRKQCEDMREQVQAALDELRHDAGNRGAIWRLRRLVARLPQPTAEAVSSEDLHAELSDYAQ